MRAVSRVALATALAATQTVAQQVFDGRDCGTTADVSTIYDYVVVGGGIGGLAMAYRLAEDGSKSVAVIEAGGFYQDTGNESVVPAYAEGAFTSISPDDINISPITWPFVTTPQAEAGGAQFRYARGKALGGT